MKRYGHNLRAGTEGDFYKRFLGSANRWPEHQSVWFQNTTYCYRRSFFKFCSEVGIGGRQYRHCRLECWCWLRWRRQWHPTPVLLPGKSHGWRRLVGCSTWGHEQSDTTEWLYFHFSLFTFLCWRRKWQPTPVFLPGESQGRGSLVGCPLWGHTESDMTEVT